MDFDPYQNGEQHHQGKATSRRLTQQGKTQSRQESQGTADLQKPDEITERCQAESHELPLEMTGCEAACPVSQK